MIYFRDKKIDREERKRRDGEKNGKEKARLRWVGEMKRGKRTVKRIVTRREKRREKRSEQLPVSC
jgi:hypothetical protein